MNRPENVDPKLWKRIQKSFESRLQYHEKKAGGGPAKKPKREKKPRNRHVSYDPDTWDDDEFVLEQAEPMLERDSSRKSNAPPKVDEANVEVGVIVSLGPGRGVVLTEEGDEVDGFLTSALAESQRTELAVGDDVRFEWKGDVVRVFERLPRRSLLSRPDPQITERERAIVANVDVVAVVCALVNPPLRPGLVDRYLIATERGGARAMVVVNKIDLASPEEFERARELLAPYEDIAAGIHWCSASKGDGVDGLRDALQEQRVAFVGHSGVGKSSLANALDPELGLAVGRVTEFAGKGRHTTTASTLARAAGIELIDTPGIREFGLHGVTPEALRGYFHDFDEAAARCSFGDCSHIETEGCGVEVAVEAGEIPRARYAAYVALHRELREG